MTLKKGKQEDYLDWSVKSFKLTNKKVSAETQIHTHMRYSEFNEILESIYAMDSDVISIEASRSKGEIEKFEEIYYDHGIGLGVYDIHSPRTPAEKEIILIVERSIKIINKELFWINPDCGLKTRSYREVIKKQSKH
jgi:5-methyltetrahydropteroyltriglutamate--homocysteine methyltransferase